VDEGSTAVLRAQAMARRSFDYRYQADEFLLFLRAFGHVAPSSLQQV
jgi:hypothetical protein